MPTAAYRTFLSVSAKLLALCGLRLVSCADFATNIMAAVNRDELITFALAAVNNH